MRQILGVDTQALRIDWAWEAVHLLFPKEVLCAIQTTTMQKDVESHLAPFSAAFF